MACTCGHAMEDHRDSSRECEAKMETMVVTKTDPLGHKVEIECPCAMYEEEEDE